MMPSASGGCLGHAAVQLMVMLESVSWLDAVVKVEESD